MAWKERIYKLTGVGSMLMHNGGLANPLDEYAKEIKKISAKRSKTDADYEEMARLEFMGGLYINGHGPAVPSYVVEATIRDGAKKNREGKTAQSGIIVEEDVILEYDGPRTGDELWNDKRFRNSALVRVGQARVVRTRPQFNNWSATLRVSYEDTVVNARQLDEWMFAAGSLVGIGDWRPKHGRFHVEVVE